MRCAASVVLLVRDTLWSWLWLAGLACAGGTVALVCHEAAHLVAARLLNGTDTKLQRRGSMVEVVTTLRSRWRVMVFLLAGPVANLAVGAGVLGLARHRVAPGLAVLGLMQLLFAASILFPFASSDGSRLIALWRRSR